MDLLARLEEELLARELPAIVLLDLDLGSAHVGRATADALGRWAQEIGATYQRCKHVATPAAFRQMLEGRLRGVAVSSVVVAICAKTTEQWKTRREIVQDEAARWNAGAEKPNVIPVHLGASAVQQQETAQALIAEALLRHWGRIPLDDGASQDDRATGTAILEARGKDAHVLAIGGNEKQRRAADEFPAAVRDRFGIGGNWILTDYSHPERVVQRIRDFYARLGSHLVTAIFAQYFNATNVKRDGQAYLRSVSVPSFTKDFKSIGSALEAVRFALAAVLQGQQGDEDSKRADEGRVGEGSDGK